MSSVSWPLVDEACVHCHRTRADVFCSSNDLNRITVLKQIKNMWLWFHLPLSSALLSPFPFLLILSTSILSYFFFLFLPTSLPSHTFSTSLILIVTGLSRLLERVLTMSSMVSGVFSSAAPIPPWIEKCFGHPQFRSIPAMSFALYIKENKKENKYKSHHQCSTPSLFFLMLVCYCSLPLPTPFFSPPSTLLLLHT